MSGLGTAWHDASRAKFLQGAKWNAEEIAQSRLRPRPPLVINRIPPLETPTEREEAFLDSVITGTGWTEVAYDEIPEEREERIMEAIRNIGR